MIPSIIQVTLALLPEHQPRSDVTAFINIGYLDFKSAKTIPLPFELRIEQRSYLAEARESQKQVVDATGRDVSSALALEGRSWRKLSARFW